MRAVGSIRSLACLALALLALGSGGSAPAQQADAPVELDSVVAVVNRQAILSSDVDRAMRLDVLEPDAAGRKPDRKSALDRLISRVLIEQQMTPDDAQAAEPTQIQIETRLTALRHELPACMRYHCATDAGWADFLAAHGLTPAQVEAYLQMRLKMLAYIEIRFHQGIHISPEEIASYYRDTLVPQYPAGQEAPSLESVSPRISEILLQQQVNALFSAWLENLRKQGDVEILDPALAPAERPAHSGGGS